MKTRRLLTLFVAVQIYSLTLTSLAIIYTGYTKWYKVDNAATTNSTREDEEVSIDVKTTSTAATTHYEEDNFVELADHDDWIHTGNEVYLYSAHWDNRSDIAMGTSVRVMGIVPVSIIEINVGITCLLWYKNKTKAIKITADIEFLQEHHEKPSRAAFIICPSPNEQLQPPYAVSLQLASQEKRLAVGLPNPLPVRMILNHSGNITDKIALCVKPVRKIISSTLTVAEFIAFYRAVGVTKFVFFSTGLTAEVWLFLRKLANKIGLEVDLLPWNLYKRSEDVHDNARIISINYCIYRYMTRYEYMAIVDFDEFMAPKRPDISLQKLLKFTERRSQFPASSFSFVNRFYCLEYGTTLKNLTVPLVTAKYTRMSTVKWPSGYLSKYIIRPALVIEAGEYRIWRTLSNTQIFTVKPYLAYLHHYTSCKEFMKGRLSVNVSENRSFMSNFTNKILESDIIRIWRE